jgi:hypothetical protein
MVCFITGRDFVLELPFTFYNSPLPSQSNTISNLHSNLIKSIENLHLNQLSNKHTYFSFTEVLNREEIPRVYSVIEQSGTKIPEKISLMEV